MNKGMGRELKKWGHFLFLPFILLVYLFFPLELKAQKCDPCTLDRELQDSPGCECKDKNKCWEGWCCWEEPGTPCGCGGTYNCEGECSAASCQAGKTCQDGQCVCVPTTCGAQGVSCGSIFDGCGGILDCGSCACPSDQENCSGTCKNLNMDAANCGACGHSCADYTSPACWSTAGWGDCPPAEATCRSVTFSNPRACSTGQCDRDYELCECGCSEGRCTLPSWNCITSACAPNGIKTRTCTESNGCNTTSGRPALSENCQVPFNAIQVSVSPNPSDVGTEVTVTCFMDIKEPDGCGFSVYDALGGRLSCQGFQKLSDAPATGSFSCNTSGNDLSVDVTCARFDRDPTDDVTCGGESISTTLDRKPPIPGTPASLVANNGPFGVNTTEVTLSWSPVAGADHYIIRAEEVDFRTGADSGRRIGPQSPPDGCGNNPHYLCQNSYRSTSFVLPVAAGSGNSYTFWVHACNESGCSAETRVSFCVDLQHLFGTVTCAVPGSTPPSSITPPLVNTVATLQPILSVEPPEVCRPPSGEIAQPFTFTIAGGVIGENYQIYLTKIGGTSLNPPVPINQGNWTGFTFFTGNNYKLKFDAQTGAYEYEARSNAGPSTKATVIVRPDYCPLSISPSSVERPPTGSRSQTLTFTLTGMTSDPAYGIHLIGKPDPAGQPIALDFQLADTLNVPWNCSQNSCTLERAYPIPSNIEIGDWVYQVRNKNNPNLFAQAKLTVHASPLPPIQTVFVIVMENTHWSSIKGSPAAPFINSLLPLGSHAEEYRSPPEAAYPSLANYIWMEQGRLDNAPWWTGRPDDSFNVAPGAGRSINNPNHLARLLENNPDPSNPNRISWMSYQEDIEEDLAGNEKRARFCPLTENAKYHPRHNPFVYFQDVTDNNNLNSQYCKDHHRPYSQLAGDLADASLNIGDPGYRPMPRYNFITPNLCNDMHDYWHECGLSANPPFCGGLSDDQCRIKTGDEWLKVEVPKIVNSQSFKDNGALFIVWDEDECWNSTCTEQPLGMIVLSPYAKRDSSKPDGYSGRTIYTHSSFLKTMQEIFGAYVPGGNPWIGDAANATNFGDLFQMTANPLALTAEMTAPILFSPQENATDVSLTPVFTWSAVAGAEGYCLELTPGANIETSRWERCLAANDPALFLNTGKDPPEAILAFSASSNWVPFGSNALSVPDFLARNTTYRWRIKAYKGTGAQTTTIYSQPHSFATMKILYAALGVDQPIVVRPDSGSRTQSLIFTVIVDELIEGSNFEPYEIWIVGDPDGPSEFNLEGIWTGRTTFSYSMPLDQNTPIGAYRYKVKNTSGLSSKYSTAVLVETGEYARRKETLSQTIDDFENSVPLDQLEEISDLMSQDLPDNALYTDSNEERFRLTTVIVNEVQ